MRKYQLIISWSYVTTHIYCNTRFMNDLRPDRVLNSSWVSRWGTRELKKTIYVTSKIASLVALTNSLQSSGIAVKPEICVLARWWWMMGRVAQPPSTVLSFVFPLEFVWIRIFNSRVKRRRRTRYETKRNVYIHVVCVVSHHVVLGASPLTLYRIFFIHEIPSGCKGSINSV